jgi:phosphoserine phosphatase
MRDANPPYGTIAFDCDSTLSTIEGIDALAAARSGSASAGLAQEIAALTERAMEGQVAVEEVYGQRLALLRPTRADLETLGALYVERRLPHAEHLVAALRFLKKRVAIVSGGLLQPVLVLARHLGIDEREVHAVEAFLDRDGRYVGYDEEAPCTQSGGKLAVARELSRADRGGGVVFVGDGITDLEAAPAVRRFVAFGGVVRRAAVFDAALVSSDAGDLAALLPLLLAPDEIEHLATAGGHEVLLHASRPQHR